MAKPRRILLITQWFDPEPSFKGLLFAKELVARGFDIEVVTGFPNYPGGRLYSGYRVRLLQREVVSGVRISRVPLYPSHDKVALHRIANYLSFSISAALYGVFFARRFDVIYAYHPPLTVGVAAALIRFFRRRPMVYDIQDIWPDTLAATGMLTNLRVLRLVDAVCRWVYSQADQISVLSPGFKARLAAKGVPLEKLSVIYNWADEYALKPSAEPSFSPLGVESGGPVTVLFAGNMGRAQGLESVLEAALLLQNEGSKVKFRFIGGGLEVNNLKLRAKSLSLDNVDFMQAVPMSEIGAVIGAADVLLVHLRPDPLFDITVPSKTQAYLCAGKPILMAVKGDAANLVERAGAGVVAEPGNAASIAAAVRQFLSMTTEDRRAMGMRGKNYYDRNLSAQMGIDQFARLFESVSFGVPRCKQ